MDGPERSGIWSSSIRLFPDNTNPKTWGVLFPSLGQTFTWGFRLKTKNTTDVPQYAALQHRVRFARDAVHRRGLRSAGVMEPVVAPKLVCSLGGPDTVRFVVDKYNPTPFNVDVHIENIGTGDARNVKAYLLQDTRFTVDVGDIAVARQPGGVRDDWTFSGANGFTVR